MLELTRPSAATILIADDDEMNRFVAEEMLATHGYQVIHAEDGATAM